LPGVVKKASQTLKIMHDKYAKDISIKEDFQVEFGEASKHNKELKAHLNKVQDDLNPIRILGLFERILDEVRDVCHVPTRFGVVLAKKDTGFKISLGDSFFPRVA
jgi:DNA-directed RNA polymerase III subunit RPC1